MNDSALPRPLEGPIALRDVFFTRRTAPLIERFLPRRAWILTVLIFLLFAAGLWSIFSHAGWGRRWDTDSMFGAAIVSWLIGEAVAALAAAASTAAQVARWRRCWRLTDAAVTLLRPLAVGQIILAQAIAVLVFLVAGLYGAFVLAGLFWRPNHLLAALPFGLAALNLAATVYAAGWAQLNFSLGWPDSWRPHWAFLVFMVASALCAVPILFAAVAVLAVSETPFRGHFLALHLLQFPFALALVWLKYALARAYAARFETVVFYLRNYGSKG